MRINLGDGFGETYMEAAYAPSNRATCRRCWEKIPKDSLRLTNTIDEEHSFHQEYHYHADCFKLKNIFNQATYKDFFHVENLTKEDQQKVQQILETLKKKQNTSLKKSKPKQQQQKKKQKKRKDSTSGSDSDYDIDNKISAILLEDKSKSLRGASSGQKNQKKGETKDQNVIKEEKSKNKQQVSDSSSDDEVDPDYFCLYNEKQKQQFKGFVTELSKKGVAELKQLLKNNDQKQVGNKTELIQRIADCQVLGCLEKCPNCYAGRPKLDKQRKLFKCPGYMDDTEFRFCNKVFQPNELKRIPWRE